MNNKSAELFERSKKIAPGGVHSPVRAFSSVGGAPIFFESAEGAYIKSVDGDSYIDFCQSFGPNLLGHRDTEVQEEVKRAVDSAWTFGACEPYSLELAEWIVENVAAVEKLRFVNSGTEAVMSALRLARAATGREKILKFEGCYHGHVDQMLVQAGSGLAGTGPGASASSSAGVSAEQASSTLVAALDDEQAVEKIFAEHGSEIAAVIVEPLPANYGLLKQRPEFLRMLRKITEQHGALLIFDEVISGFRVQLDGMAGKHDIRPDLLTYGKVIGGGFPVGCYGGRADLLDLVAPSGEVYQAGTLSANPIGMRAGLCALKKAKRENVFAVLEQRTASFVDKLQKVIDRSGHSLSIVREASLFWICGEKITETPRELSQLPANQNEIYKPLFHGLLDSGVYLAPSGYEIAFVSFAHTEEILGQAVVKFETALTK